MRAWPAPTLVLVLLLLCAPGCAPSGVDLLVDLRTDWVSGLEMVGVRTEVFAGPATGTPLRAYEVIAARGTSFVTARRVAELSGLREGDYTARVTLVAPDGSTRAQRLVQVSLRARLVVTVLITRDCAGVTCPAPAGDPALTECVGGSCVDPACTVEHPERCATPACASDGDCPGGPACTVAACVAGACLLDGHDERCGAHEWCSPDDGCEPLFTRDGSVPPMDAAMIDAAVPMDGGCAVRPDPRGDGSLRISGGGSYCPPSADIRATYVCVEGMGRIEVPGGADRYLELYGPEATSLGGVGIVPTGPGATLHVRAASDAAWYVALDLSSYGLAVEIVSGAASGTLVARGPQTLTLTSITGRNLYISHEGPRMSTGTALVTGYTPDGAYVAPPACPP